MKKIIYATEKIKLDFNENNISVNKIDIDRIIDECSKKYSDKYTIDIQNHIATIVGYELIVSFKLIEKQAI